MKELITETYKDFELKSWEGYIDEVRYVIAYAYKMGKSKNKQDYIYQSPQKPNKMSAIMSLKYQIDKNTNKISNEELFNILANQYNNIIQIKNNKLYILHIDEFDWLKKTIKNRYGIIIKLEGNEIKW